MLKDGKYYVYGANGIIGKYDKYNHEEYQITIACRGSIGQVTYTLPFSWITGNAMVVKPKNDFSYKEFLYYSLLCKPVNYLTSGSVQPQLTRENLELYTLPFTNIDDVKKFDNLAKMSRKQILNNDYENIKLISLKNYLLPLLINGQATIS